MPRDRPDLSSELVHFVRGEHPTDAWGVLRQIVEQRCLLGGDGFIKGGFRCVCFSEAPLDALGSAIREETRAGRVFQPFGIMVPKRWLFDLGGRPVIYQPDAEFEQLPDSHRWRHVRFEPTRDPPIDFSWEREWRIQTDRLELNPAVCTIVVPDASFTEELKREHKEREDKRELMIAQVLDDILAWRMRKDFSWSIHELTEQQWGGTGV